MEHRTETPGVLRFPLEWDIHHHRRTSFRLIQKVDTHTVILRKVNTKLDAHNPQNFIICARKTAKSIGKSVLKTLKRERTDYNVEGQESEKGLLVFISKKRNNFDGSQPTLNM